MKQKLITDVVQGMLPYLNNAQAEKLQMIMQCALFNYEVTENENRDGYDYSKFITGSDLERSRTISGV